MTVGRKDQLKNPAYPRFFPPACGPLRFAPPGLPLKPEPFGPDLEKPPVRGLDDPPGLNGLLLGRAPPARGLPLLVVKGRARPLSPRGGRADRAGAAPAR